MLNRLFTFKTERNRTTQNNTNYKLKQKKISYFVFVHFNINLCAQYEMYTLYSIHTINHNNKESFTIFQSLWLKIAVTQFKMELYNLCTTKNTFGCQ